MTFCRSLSDLLLTVTRAVSRRLATKIHYSSGQRLARVQRLCGKGVKKTKNCIVYRVASYLKLLLVKPFSLQFELSIFSFQDTSLNRLLGGKKGEVKQSSELLNHLSSWYWKGCDDSSGWPMMSTQRHRRLTQFSGLSWYTVDSDESIDWLKLAHSS